MCISIQWPPSGDKLIYAWTVGIKIKNKNQYKSYDKSSIQYSVVPFFTVNLGIVFHILLRNIQTRTVLYIKKIIKYRFGLVYVV